MIDTNKLNELYELLEQEKFIKNSIATLKAEIETQMNFDNLDKFENEKIKISYSKESRSLKFNEEKFKEDNPDLYDKYLVEKVRKGYYRYTAK